MINAEKCIAIEIVFKIWGGKLPNWKFMNLFAKDATSIFEPASFCLNYYSFNFPLYALFNNLLNICRNKYWKKHCREISFSTILTGV